MPYPLSLCSFVVRHKGFSLFIGIINTALSIITVLPAKAKWQNLHRDFSAAYRIYYWEICV